MSFNAIRVMTAVGRVSTWSGRLGALIVFPLVGAMVWEVGARYLFDAPTSWAFELSYMMMGAIFLMGLSYALHMDAHVRVDFIHSFAPKRLTAGFDALCFLCLTALFAWLTWALAWNAHRVFLTGEGSGLSAWNPTIWPYRLIYVAGFGLMTLQTAATTLARIMTAAGIDPGPDHAPGDGPDHGAGQEGAA